MSQTIHYNTLPIPVREPMPDLVVPAFEAMRRLELPGILLPGVGPDKAAAMDTLEPVLAACGVAIHRAMDTIDHPDGIGDQPLHIDSIPYDADSVGMVLQYTEDGSADIVLAKLAGPFCEELAQREGDINDYSLYRLPRGTEALLDEGYIDPDVLNRDVYVGSVAAGGAIMFTIGGPNPIAHRFRTTTPKRRAHGYMVPFTRL